MAKLTIVYDENGNEESRHMSISFFVPTDAAFERAYKSVFENTEDIDFEVVTNQLPEGK